ncbi:MAG: hypothetical protein M1820_009692 [Bogoriella megaspora]|nr:MAG: hypothetical protein M1820_009692 [Bogoriella megaspora]
MTELPHPRIDSAMSTSGGRTRAESINSLRGPPHNTPDTQSVWGRSSEHSPDLDDVDERLATTALNDPLGLPTIVPDNTPHSSTPASHYRATISNLPSIDEKIEQLPPIRVPSSYAASSRADNNSEVEHGDVPIIFGRRNSVRSATSPQMLTYPDEGADKPLRRSVSATTTNTGVREHSDWHDEVMAGTCRDLLRLRNLADDDHDRDPSKSANEHFTCRLLSCLHKSSRNGPYESDAEYLAYEMSGLSPLPSIPRSGTCCASGGNRHEVKATRLTSADSVESLAGSQLYLTVPLPEIKDLRPKLDGVMRLMAKMLEVQEEAGADVHSIKRELAELRDATA